MIFWRNPLRFVLFALLLIPAISFGQFFPRLEIGGSYVYTTGQYNGTTTVLDGGGRYAGDTTIKRNITGSGYGFDIGSTFRIKRIGHTSLLGVSVHLLYNEFTWSNINETYGLNGAYTINSGNNLDATTTQIALPISLDYKLGPDAILTKRLHIGATFGIGLIPSYNQTAMVNTANISGTGGGVFGINPFAKAEISFFGGLCFKIRGQFAFGNIPFVNQTTALPSLTDGPFKFSGSTNTMVSFIIMPFSPGWKETGWYDTFDTYNPYER